jgi:hypothetical protein
MMNPRTQVYIFLLGLAVLLFVINLVRTRKLQERYAILWLLAGISLVIAPLIIHWLDRIAYALGFDYPPALLLLLAIVGLLLIIFQLSLSISQNATHLKVLTQEIGLLRQEVEELEERWAEHGDVAEGGSDQTAGWRDFGGPADTEELREEDAHRV